MRSKPKRLSQLGFPSSKEKMGHTLEEAVHRVRATGLICET